MIKTFRLLWPHLAILFVLFFFAFTYYSTIVDSLPIGIHSWAQGDRLSLAYGFYDNGMDFLHPATNNLGSDFGIVGVEFPLQAYLAAVLAKIWGRESLSTCFRLVDMGIAILGLYFLFLTIYSRTKNFFIAAFAPLFFFCSPVYIFYSGNYLPDPASVSITFIAFYFLLKYFEEDSFLNLLSTGVFLTLASLIKTSTVHYLIGFMALSFYWQLKQRAASKLVFKSLLVFGMMIGLLLVNFLHIQYLNTHYHSTLFLSKINPFITWDDVGNYFDDGFKNKWMGDYFMLSQYPVYLIVVLIGLSLAAKDTRFKPALFLVILYLIGSLFIAGLFGLQLTVHDYYVLPIFFPLLAFMLLISVLAIAEAIKTTKLLTVSVSATLLLLFFFADHQTYQRFHGLGVYYAGNNQSVTWMKKGRLLLQQLKIPTNEKIMVADEDPPNLSLVYFDRRGYTMPNSWWQCRVPVIEEVMMEKKTPLLIMKAATLDSINQKDPNAFKDYQLVGLKDEVAVLRLMNPI